MSSKYKFALFFGLVFKYLFSIMWVKFAMMQVYGIPRLRVIDASIMPTIVSGTHLQHWNIEIILVTKNIYYYVSWSPLPSSSSLSFYILSRSPFSLIRFFRKHQCSNNHDRWKGIRHDQGWLGFLGWGKPFLNESPGTLQSPNWLGPLSLRSVFAILKRAEYGLNCCDKQTANIILWEGYKFVNFLWEFTIKNSDWEPQKF